MRIELDWRRFGTITWFLISVVGVSATLLQVFVSDLPHARGTTGKIALVVALVSLLIAAFVSRFPKTLTWKLRNQNRRRPDFHIGRGDLFDDPPQSGTVTVVTTNLRFALNDVVEVNDKSLIAQLAKRRPDNRDEIVRQAKVDQPHPAEAGTIQEVVLDGRRYWLMAVAEVVRDGEAAHDLPLTNLWTALSQLWIRADSNVVSLRMPIIGSGQSGAHQVHEALLMVIALSLMAHRAETSDQNYDSVVDVVVHRTDLTPGRMRRFARSLGDMGFKRVRR